MRYLGVYIQFHSPESVKPLYNGPYTHAHGTLGTLGIDRTVTTAMVNLIPRSRQKVVQLTFDRYIINHLVLR